MARILDRVVCSHDEEVRIFSYTLNLLTAAKVVNRHTAYMDSFFASPRKRLLEVQVSGGLSAVP